MIEIKKLSTSWQGVGMCVAPCASGLQRFSASDQDLDEKCGATIVLQYGCSGEGETHSPSHREAFFAVMGMGRS